MKKCRVAAVLGTRPEAIKLALVVHELQRRSQEFEPVVIATGQHRSMLDQVLHLFQITPDVDLGVMRPNQTLQSLTSLVLEEVDSALQKFAPDLVLVQGDTTTAFASALAAYYRKIPVGHVEAGLRSDDLYNPFPEEGNRRLATVLSEIHFAPTTWARDRLLAESVPAQKIVVTGNTVVDSLKALGEAPACWKDTPLSNVPVDGSRFLLVTSHRRESWGADQESMCLALRDLINRFPDLHVVFPLHLNPNVRSTVNRLLAGVERVHLIEPLNYFTFVGVLRRCYVVLTDSGGIQEEAPSFGKPVLVLRKQTERPEASRWGLAKLIGMSREIIFRETERLLSDPDAYLEMTDSVNPYGDGRAAERIVEVLARWWQKKTPLLDPDKEFKVAARPTPRRRKSDLAAPPASADGFSSAAHAGPAASRK